LFFSKRDVDNFVSNLLITSRAAAAAGSYQQVTNRFSTSFQQANMNQTLQRLLRQGLAEQVFLGAAAAAACGIGPARQTWTAWAGVMDSRDQSPVTEDTLFDLASLSKALATTLLFYSFFAEGRLRLEDRLADLLPDAPPDKRQISLRSLLSHSSGLAAYQPWFKTFAPVQKQDNKARLLRLIFNEPLAYAPESRCLYSDLGFILLGWIAEELTGKDLAANFQERIAGPLGLEKELLCQVSVEQRQSCAATEQCPWRRRMMRGEVHDEHCWLLNGLAGHAGLFGTVGGVLRLCGVILDNWKGEENAASSWAAFLAQGLQPQTWRLGFGRPTPGSSSSGRHFSAQSIGHLGFTGTSFWIDPEQELIVVLLSNRVHPSRENSRIRQFRPWFHDAAVEAVKASWQDD
jgi:CubicO group peptidase (beta-lactamase class C family)